MKMIFLPVILHDPKLLPIGFKYRLYTLQKIGLSTRNYDKEAVIMYHQERCLGDIRTNLVKVTVGIDYREL